MFFLEKLIKGLLGLPTLLCILSATGIGLYLFNRRKIGRNLILLAIIVGWFFSTNLGLYCITYPLISNLSEIKISQIPTGANILVLGGGCRKSDGSSKAEQLSNPSLRRVMEGYRIWRQVPASQLIFSGIDWRRGCNIAEIASNMVREWTSDTSRIVQLNPALNTRQEASLYLQKYGNRDTLVLVSSAIHLPRAVRNFIKCGIPVIHAPTDFPIHDNKTALWNIMIDMGNFEKSASAWIEWIANIAGK